MEAQTKSCQNCKKDFTIEPEDFNYYEKINVPPPTWCPECRFIRRLSFMNMHVLYKRNCDLCGKNIISMYHPDKEIEVYCMPCWWGDTWDGTEYAMEYDPNKKFFDQLVELKNKTPFATLEALYTSNINSEYVNYTAYQRNSYLAYFGDYAENVLYTTFFAHIREIVDCYYIQDSELCYESIGGNKLYNCHYTIDCGDCHDVHFSRNCYDCSNCFGCVNLRNKNYYIWNKQYTKEEYKKKIAEINLGSWQSVSKAWEEFQKFSLKFPRRFYMGDSKNKNVTGNYIYDSKNAHDIYMSIGVEDSRYVSWTNQITTKDCYDYTGWGYNSERIYECSIVGEGAYNVHFSNECWPNAMNVEYSMYAISNCKDCFGCVNLKKKQYCILNKQYSKEEYEKLKAQIIADMNKNPYIDQNGRIYKYGEFLPLMMSPFSYNETLANGFFPISKDQALKDGFTWFEAEKPVYKITKKSSQLPDDIKDVLEEILNDVIECSTCGRGFRIVTNEFLLLRKFNIPLPRSCPECRHRARFKEINPPKLYNRVCMKCGKDIRTSYSPDRPEIVYCEKCYQQEIY
jgi:hypothetical protein